MKRRSFLKKLGAGLMLLLTPSLPKLPTPKSGGIFEISGRTISFVGPNDHPGFTALEFHRWLQDLFEEPTMLDLPNPSSRYHDEMISLENGFHLDESAIMKIKEGALRQTEPDKTTSIYFTAEARTIRSSTGDQMYYQQDGEKL